MLSSLLSGEYHGTPLPFPLVMPYRFPTASWQKPKHTPRYQDECTHPVKRSGHLKLYYWLVLQWKTCIRDTYMYCIHTKDTTAWIRRHSAKVVYGAKQCPAQFVWHSSTAAVGSPRLGDPTAMRGCLGRLLYTVPTSHIKFGPIY